MQQTQPKKTNEEFKTVVKTLSDKIEIINDPTIISEWEFCAVVIESLLSMIMDDNKIPQKYMDYIAKNKSLLEFGCERAISCGNHDFLEKITSRLVHGYNFDPTYLPLKDLPIPLLQYIKSHLYHVLDTCLDYDYDFGFHKFLSLDETDHICYISYLLDQNNKERLNRFESIAPKLCSDKIITAAFTLKPTSSQSYEEMNYTLNWYKRILKKTVPVSSLKNKNKG